MSLTDEQLRLRLEAYGASEIATIVGKGPGKLVDVWNSKVNPRPRAVLDEEMSLVAELGTLEEEPTARVYARRTKTFLARVGTIRHPTLPLAIATPDRARFVTAGDAEAALGGAELITDRDVLRAAERLVEVKTTGSRYRRAYGEPGTGVVPDEKAIQGTWQLGVTGHLVVDLPVLFRGEWGVTLETFVITWNAALFGILYEAVERFHRDYVVTKKPPPPDASKAYDDVLAKAYPANTRPAIIADGADEELMLRFAKFDEVYKRVSKLRKTAQQQLKARIGDASGIVSDTLGKVHWRRTKDGTKVDWERAANDAIALCGLCLNAFDVIKKGGEHLSDENREKLVARLKAIVPDASSVKPGHRRLTPYFKGAAQLELAQLNIALDALEAGPPEHDEAPLDVEDDELDVSD